MKKLLPLLLILLTHLAHSQNDHQMHDMNNMPGMDMKKKPAKKKQPKKTMNMQKDTTMKMDHSKMDMPMDSTKKMPMNHSMNMTIDSNDSMNVPSAFSRNLPMSMNGSGTTWHPQNSPMYMNMTQKRGWNLMLHYGLFMTYSNQNINRAPGQRGGSDYSAPNWLMLMTNRLVGKRGLFMIRGMFSLDPLTVGGAGYPLLFQTGETWKGKPLIDHQHPHDLISELSVGYSHAFTKNTDLYLYLGIPGEPSVGPPAFMHRPSALNLPSSPISHHWQDATHFTYGVSTLGFRYRMVKFEGSVFTGREPNENRYNFDKLRFDSYSGRISVNPLPSLALQASYGHLKSPETIEPDIDVDRYSASALHNYWFNDQTVLSSSFAWGLNKYVDNTDSDITYGHSFLLESNLQTQKYSYFTRLEAVQKSNEELVIPSGDPHQNNTIGQFMLGASRYISKNPIFWLDLGIIGTAYAFSSDFNNYYGRNPYSVEVFLRMIPPRMMMNMNSKMKM